MTVMGGWTGRRMDRLFGACLCGGPVAALQREAGR